MPPRVGLEGRLLCGRVGSAVRWPRAAPPPGTCNLCVRGPEALPKPLLFNLPSASEEDGAEVSLFSAPALEN